MDVRPTLLSSCARAATAAEARFRIDAAIPSSRGARIIALDDGAAVIVRRIARQQWGGAHFLTYDAEATRPSGNGDVADIVLTTADGSEVRLREELAGADVTMMVATADDGADAASVIGEACSQRGIMTAGVVFGEGRRVAAAVSALRPHAQVLLVSRDEEDVPEVLTALRA